MNPTKTTAKDFFLNLGSIVALYTVVMSLINLLFTVINRAYPQVTNEYYGYVGTSSISWPVAMLIIVFPIFIFLMWFLEKGFASEPEKRNIGVRKWLTYITLFMAGIVLAGDLITVLYYFIDGQELTTSFLLKVLTVFVITFLVFYYYISEIRGKLNQSSRKIWAIVGMVLVLGSIIWGFSVLGSPRTQRLYKYDEAKVNDLTNISSMIDGYYNVNGKLPNSLSDLTPMNYGANITDAQTQKPYEYQKVSGTKYNICAEFNSESPEVTTPNIYARPIGYVTWTHPKGHYCFERAVNLNIYGKPIPVQ